MLSKTKYIKKYFKEYCYTLITFLLNAIVGLAVIFPLVFSFESQKFASKTETDAIFSPEYIQKVKQVFGEDGIQYHYLNIAMDFLGVKISSDFNVWVPIFVSFFLFGFFFLIIKVKKTPVEETHALFYMQKASLKASSTIVPLFFFFLVFILFATLFFLFLALYIDVAFKPFWVFGTYSVMYFVITLGFFTLFKFLEAKIEEPYKDK